MPHWMIDLDPTAVQTIVSDVIARKLRGRDPLDVRRRTQDMHVLLTRLGERGGKRRRSYVSSVSVSRERT